MDVAGHLVFLDENEAIMNMLKQASMVIILLKEVVGLEMPVRLRLVAQVKKGCIKRARERDVKRSKRYKNVMRLEQIKLKIKLFYKRPKKKVSPVEGGFWSTNCFCILE